MTKKRQPAKTGSGGGSYGIFGKRRGDLLWISGFVSAQAFIYAKGRLEHAYELVHNEKPPRITKPDVIEFLMMGEAEAIQKMSAQRRERGGRRLHPATGARG